MKGHGRHFSHLELVTSALHMIQPDPIWFHGNHIDESDQDSQQQNTITQDYEAAP